MGDLETVKIKQGDDYAVINKSDYDPKVHQLADGQKVDADGKVSDVVAEQEALRQHNANRGIPAQRAASDNEKNPSGTYSEPTPTDIRYPNKDETEFENNHGAFVGKSAAQMRDTQGLPDAPGGLSPQALHVGKGPRGKYYVKDGRDIVSDAFDTEDEASAELANGDKADDKAAKPQPQRTPFNPQPAVPGKVEQK